MGLSYAGICYWSASFSDAQKHVEREIYGHVDLVCSRMASMGVTDREFFGLGMALVNRVDNLRDLVPPGVDIGFTFSPKDGEFNLIVNGRRYERGRLVWPYFFSVKNASAGE